MLLYFDLYKTKFLPPQNIKEHPLNTAQCLNTCDEGIIPIGNVTLNQKYLN